MSGTTGTTRTKADLLQIYFKDNQAAASIAPVDMRDLIESLNSITAIYLANLPTSVTGLNSGDIYWNSGVLTRKP